MKNSKSKRYLACLFCGILSSCSSIYSVKKFNKGDKPNLSHTKSKVRKVHKPLTIISKTEGFLNFLPSSGGNNFQYTFNGKIVKTTDLLKLPLPLFLVCYQDVLRSLIQNAYIRNIQSNIYKTNMIGFNEEGVRHTLIDIANRNFEVRDRELLKSKKNIKYFKHFAKVCKFKIPSFDYCNDDFFKKYELGKQLVIQHYNTFLTNKAKYFPLANTTLNKELNFKQKVFEILENHHNAAANNNNNNNNNSNNVGDQCQK